MMEGWSTFLAGLTGLLAAIGTGVVTYLTMKHKQNLELRAMEHQHAKELLEERRKDKDDERKDRTEQAELDGRAIHQYQEIADRLEKQNARWEVDSKSKQKLIDELVERDTLCQIRLHKFYAWMQQSDTWMRAAMIRIAWLTNMAKEAGHEVGDMIESPKLPEPPREYDNTPSFQARSQAQNTEIIKAANPVTAPPSKPSTEP